MEKWNEHSKGIRKEGITLKAIDEDIVQRLDEDCLSYATVKIGTDITEDCPRSGHPKSSTTEFKCMLFIV